MLRYKTVESLKQQTRTRIQTTLRLNTKQTQEKNKTALRQKRRIIVYKKDGKFFIEHTAAYALKLTNVRSIMIENTPHLFEIGLETLYSLQNDEDIEIEYQGTSIEKEESNLLETLSGLEEGEYGIGIHGIHEGNIEEKQNIADSINQEGLNINNNSRSILSTAISLGRNDDTQRICDEISGYKYNVDRNKSKCCSCCTIMYSKSKRRKNLFRISR